MSGRPVGQASWILTSCQRHMITSGQTDRLVLGVNVATWACRTIIQGQQFLLNIFFPLTRFCLVRSLPILFGFPSSDRLVPPFAVFVLMSEVPTVMKRNHRNKAEVKGSVKETGLSGRSTSFPWSHTLARV